MSIQSYEALQLQVKTMAPRTEYLNAASGTEGHLHRDLCARARGCGVVALVLRFGAL